MLFATLSQVKKPTNKPTNPEKHTHTQNKSNLTTVKKKKKRLANTFAQKTCSELQLERPMFWKVMNTSKQDLYYKILQVLNLTFIFLRNYGRARKRHLSKYLTRALF